MNRSKSKIPTFFCGLAFPWKLIKRTNSLLANVRNALTSGLFNICSFVDLTFYQMCHFFVLSTVDVWVKTNSL